MNATIDSICLQKGKIKINRPDLIKENIKSLVDLVELLQLHDEFKALDFTTLPDSAIGPMIDIANRCHKPDSLCFDFAAVLIVNALKETKFPDAEQATVNDFTAKVKKISSKYARLFDKNNPIVSRKIRDRYLTAEKAIQSGFLHKRALAALSTVISELITSLKLKVKIETLSINDLNALIRAKCQKGLVKIILPRKVPPKTNNQPKQPPVNLEYSLRIGSGFGYRLPGDAAPEALANQERGVLMQGGASARLNISPKLSLQADYNASAPYDVIGDDNLVSNNDFGRISGIYKPTEKIDLFGSVGWQYYRNDYPSKTTPDLNALQEQLRVNYRVKPNLSINFDQTLTAGWINETFPAEKSGFKVIRAIFEPGVSYQINAFTPFAGAVAGYSKDGAELGGYLGASLALKAHEVDLRTSATKLNGIFTQARYLWHKNKWGIGTRLEHSNDFDGQNIFGATAFGRIPIAKLLGQSIELQPEVNFSGDYKDSKMVSNISGLILLRAGSLRPTAPANLKPYSVLPLVEEK